MYVNTWISVPILNHSSLANNHFHKETQIYQKIIYQNYLLNRRVPSAITFNLFWIWKVRKKGTLLAYFVQKCWTQFEVELIGVIWASPTATDPSTKVSKDTNCFLNWTASRPSTRSDGQNWLIYRREVN